MPVRPTASCPCAASLRRRCGRGHLAPALRFRCAAEQRDVCATPIEGELADGVVERTPAGDLPCCGGGAHTTRAGECGEQERRRTRTGHLHDASLGRAEWIAEGRADDLVDTARARLRAEIDRRDIAGVDVAAEDDDGRRRLVASADRSQKLREMMKGLLVRGPVFEVDGSPEPFAQPSCERTPGAVADRLVPGLEVVDARRQKYRQGRRDDQMVESTPACSAIHSHSSASIMSRRPSTVTRAARESITNSRERPKSR